VASDLNPTEHLRSYHELLRSDTKQTLDPVNVVDRTRTCTETIPDPIDPDNTITLTTIVNITIRSTLSTAGANNSPRFFACFEGNGTCGRSNDAEPALPANCVEDQLLIVPPTMATYDHTGILSDAELRLLSEWLDIGVQYYNNPFDPRILP
jgi:hypothetical protein